MTEEDNKPLPLNNAKWWANKRRMAYISLGGLVGLAVFAFVNPVTEPQASLLIAIAYSFGGIIAAYIGISGWDDLNARNGRK